MNSETLWGELDCRRGETEEARRHAENALQQLRVSEAQLRFVTEHSADTIMRIDRQSRILFVSPGCRRYGYEPNELIGRTGLELVHPEDVPRVQATFANLFSGAPVDKNRDRSYRLLTKAGGWTWMETNPSIIRDEHGHPIELVSVHRDISERKAAADALGESERRYRMLANNIIDLIVSYNTEGVIDFVSPSIQQFGYEPEHVLGRRMSDLSHPDDLARSEALFHACKEGRRTDPVHVWRTRRADGRLLWLEGTTSRMTDDSGRWTGNVTVYRDVTSRLELEEQLRRKSADADAAALSKSQFLANMSHEIRNPLTVVIGYGQLLQKAAGLPARAQAYIERINMAARSLLAIVDDVLDFSRLEAGKIELDPHAFELELFLNETVDQYRATSTNKGLDVRIIRRGELPAIVRADRRRLQQVLSNLIANAIKFTESGQVTVAVDSQSEKDARLRFEVIDTGIGISAENAGRLFERFSQIDASNTRSAGGSGLGLVIAKGLIEMMGGEIGVTSEPGAGSTFWFTIKLQAEARSVASEISPSVTWDGGPLSILMVEDVAVNRELVSELLAHFNIEVTCAADGVEALKAAHENRFDVILMDIQMPRMDGLAATQAIRADSSCPSHATPILALSANVFQPQVDACFKAGMNGYIRKPIDTAELLAKIAHLTRGEVAS